MAIAVRRRGVPRAVLVFARPRPAPDRSAGGDRCVHRRTAKRASHSRSSSPTACSRSNNGNDIVVVQPDGSGRRVLSLVRRTGRPVVLPGRAAPGVLVQDTGPGGLGSRRRRRRRRQPGRPSLRGSRRVRPDRDRLVAGRDHDHVLGPDRPAPTHRSCHGYAERRLLHVAHLRRRRPTGPAPARSATRRWMRGVPAWSPDGSTIAFGGGNATPSDGRAPLPDGCRWLQRSPAQRRGRHRLGIRAGRLVTRRHEDRRTGGRR